MEGQGNSNIDKRVSERATKGIPPARLGVATTGMLQKKKSSKRSSSSKESARQRKDAEAQRDSEIALLMNDHADKRKQKRILSVQIRKTQRELEKIKECKEASKVDDQAVHNLEQQLAELTDNLDILEAELESIENTQDYQLAAINSKFQAELERISSDDDFPSSSEDDEDAKERTRTWAENQLKGDNEDNISMDVSTIYKNPKYNSKKDDKVAGIGKEDVERYHDANNRNRPPTLYHRNLSPVESGWYSPPPFCPSEEACQRQDSDAFPRWRGDYQPVSNNYNRQGGTDCYTAPGGNAQIPGINLRAHGTRQKPTKAQADHDGTQGNDMVSQLVTALGQAFGNQRNEVIVKAPVDKNLPKFGGNPGDWENFRSEYVRTTSKFKFEDSENLTRLRSSLEGDALNAVKHLMANPGNLRKIWEHLEKRFGRPEFVLDYLVERAKATKQPDPSKPETMVDFGTAIDALVTNICAYNQLDYMNNRQLVNEFVGKLPSTLRTQWHEWVLDGNGRKPTLEYFSTWINKKMDAAIMAMKPKNADGVTASSEEKKRGRIRGHGSVNASPGENGESGKKPCLSCGKKNHRLAKCWKFAKSSVQDRWKIVKENRCCLSCLDTGHRSRNCPDASKCSQEGCDYWHNMLLHSDVKRQKESSSRKEEAPVATAEGDGVVNAAIIKGVDGPMRIVPVKLKRKNATGSVNAFALLDSGATKTLIVKSLAEDLGLDGENIGSYSYSGVGTEKITVNNAKRVECQIAGTYPRAHYNTMKNCVTVDEIRMTPYSFDSDEAKKFWPHLRKMKMETLVKVVPSLIIGNNNPELQLPNRIVRGSINDPVALRTELGWVVAGDFDVESGHSEINAISGGEEATDDYLHDLMKAWFTTESFGVKVSTQKGGTLEEKRAWKILEETTKKLPGGWETGLLWREDNVKFADTEREALKRLEYTEKKMARDPTFKQKYVDKFAEYLQKGYMKKLTPEEAAERPPHTRYIPHFGLINPNKPDKFRFILDAKAKTQGISLNDKLLKGPELIRSLVSVLMNFRVHLVVLTGDISDMYHRIQLRKEDRCSQRVLWRDGESSRDPDHYQMEVLFFGSTSSQSSAIYVKDRNAEEFAKVFPAAVSAIKTDFYSDDLLTGGNSTAQVINLRQQISQIHDAGGFTLCKFLSNSPEVLESIPDELKAAGVKGLKEKEEIPSERVLGLWWDPNDDAFTFKLSLHKVKQSVLQGEIPTKRQMCGLVMSLYDPLGFISQYRVKGLMILQDVWRCGTGWDDEIPSEINVRWQQWLSRIQEITHVKVPRCYSTFLSGADDVQLHIFQDASEQGFSAVCYLRIRTGSEVNVALVFSKARVAPLKKLTIPKLELQAAVMGTRMAVTVGNELRIKTSSRWFWSDSKTVLCWIRSTAVRYKEFVANRIGEIQEVTNASEWHWVPTKLNIADQATRFESDISMAPDSEWYSGPPFLKGDPSEFPKETTEGVVAAWSGSLEDDTGVHPSTSEKGGLKSTKNSNPLFGNVPSPKRFSSFLRLLRATAATNKYIHAWIQLGKKIPRNEIDFTISSEDIAAAEETLIKYAQWDNYSEEIHDLSMGNHVGKRSAIWRLDPVLDNRGVLRVNGRIGAADVGEAMKFPAILPQKHYITELIIDREHKSFAHQGVESVLASLRQKYWIPEGRKAVQRSWTRCMTCRLRRVKPIPPKMGDLPYFRLASYQPAFTFTGLDFFGPLIVTVGRRHEKRWGALFCCEVTRAVHLEICHGLSTDEVMLAISRFVDSRGRPALIISDNGTNFVGAAKELKENLQRVDFERVKRLGRFQEIKWVFNPPAAPHMGGSWERLVQTVKKCLGAVLHEKYPKDTTLLTLFKSVENMVNSRPLTHVSNDPADPAPITPNHILRGGSDVGPGIPAKMEYSDEFVRAQWRRSQLLADQFWTRWTREFLPRLLKRDKWHRAAVPLEIGELVYLVDDTLPRNCWQRGYISAVFPGKDGQVRVVEVTTRDSSSKKATVYKRPTTKICPLGLKMEIQDSKEP